MKLLKICLYFVSVYLCLVCTGVEAVGAGGGKKLLCWTNSDGVKECGDKLPPEYAQEEHEELSKKTGSVVKETERAKTEEQLAEEKKQAAIKAEEERVAKEQTKKDKILLDTFTNVKDIEMARDSKITTLESSIAVTEKRGTKMQADLDNRINQAAASEREGKTPPEHLRKDIESLQRQIKSNNDFIATTRKEEEEVKASYGRDIARYKELTATE
jgi:hypothetical protein